MISCSICSSGQICKRCYRSFHGWCCCASVHVLYHQQVIPLPCLLNISIYSYKNRFWQFSEKDVGLKFCFTSFTFPRKLRYETDLAENMTWKIKYEDLSIKGQEQQEAKPVGMLAIFNRATGSGPTGHSMVGGTT